MVVPALVAALAQVPLDRRGPALGAAPYGGRLQLDPAEAAQALVVPLAQAQGVVDATAARDRAAAPAAQGSERLPAALLLVVAGTQAQGTDRQPAMRVCAGGIHGDLAEGRSLRRSFAPVIARPGGRVEAFRPGIQVPDVAERLRHSEAGRIAHDGLEVRRVLPGVGRTPGQVEGTWRHRLGGRQAWKAVGAPC